MERKIGRVFGRFDIKESNPLHAAPPTQVENSWMASHTLLANAASELQPW